MVLHSGLALWYVIGITFLKSTVMKKLEIMPDDMAILE
jgi:hypothetical protein